MAEAEIDLCPSGLPSSRAAGARLQSRVDPVQEASRFLDSSRALLAPSFIVVIGPCIDYLSPELERRHPAARVVAVQLCDAFSSLPSPRPVWFPGSAEPLAEFLRRNAPGGEADGMEVVSWPPAERAFPERARLAAEAVSSFARESLQDISTRGAFGRRWTLNAARNLMRTENYAVPRSARGVAVIAASGPSLAEAAGDIAALGKRALVIATASALRYLGSRGIRSGIAVSTDGGYYAGLLCREAAPGQIVAMPLTAHPLPRAGVATLALDQGSWQEGELRAVAGFPALGLPPHGTVTGTAFSLAVALGLKELLVAGLDLAASDIRSHASPHPFEELFAAAACRLAPLHSVLSDRAFSQYPLREGARRRSPAMESYGARFASPSGRARAYRLRPSPYPALGLEDAATLPELSFRGEAALEVELVAAPPPGARREAVRLLARNIVGTAAGAKAAFFGGAPLPADANRLYDVDAPSMLRARKAARSGDARALREAAESLEAAAGELAQRLGEIAGW